MLIFQSTIDSLKFDDQKPLMVMQGDPADYFSLLDSFPITQALRSYLGYLLQAADNFRRLPDALIRDGVAFIPFDYVTENMANYGKTYNRATHSKKIRVYIESNIFEEQYIELSPNYKKRLIIWKPILELRSNFKKKQEDEVDEHGFSSSRSESTPRSIHQRELKRLKRSKVPTSFGTNQLASLEKTYTDRRFALIAESWRDTPQEKTKVLMANLSSGRRSFPVKSSANVNVPLACKADLATINALTTICRIAIEEIHDLGGDPQNSFLIDLSDLCILKKLQELSSNRVSQANSIMRLHGTVTMIRLDQSKEADILRRLLLLDQGELQSISFVKSFSFHDEYIGDKTRTSPRWVRISIDEVVFKSLLRPYNNPDTPLIAVHPELMEFENKSKPGSGTGIFYVLYNFLNIKIGRTKGKTSSDGRSYTIDELQRGMAPSSRLSVFQDLITNAAKQMLLKSDTRGRKPEWQKESLNTYTALGFEMEWSTNALGLVQSVRFKRDIGDPITGDNSYHNLMTAKTKSAHKEMPQQGELILQDEFREEEGDDFEPVLSGDFISADVSDFADTATPSRNKTKKELKAEVNAALTDVNDHDW